MPTFPILGRVRTALWGNRESGRRRRLTRLAAGLQELEPRRLLTPTMGNPPAITIHSADQYMIQGYFQNDFSYGMDYMDVVEENGNPPQYQFNDFSSDGMFVIMISETLEVGQTKEFQFTPVEQAMDYNGGYVSQTGQTVTVTVTGQDDNHAPYFSWIQADGELIIGRALDEDPYESLFVEYRAAGAQNWLDGTSTSGSGNFSLCPYGAVPWGSSGDVEVRVTDGRAYSAVSVIFVDMTTDGSANPQPSGSGSGGSGSSDPGTNTGYTGSGSSSGSSTPPTATAGTTSSSSSLQSSAAPSYGSSLFESEEDELFLDAYFGVLI